MRVGTSFTWLNVPLCGRAARLVGHSLVDGHSSFRFLAIVDNAAMDILELSQGETVTSLNSWFPPVGLPLCLRRFLLFLCKVCPSPLFAGLAYGSAVACSSPIAILW